MCVLGVVLLVSGIISKFQVFGDLPDEAGKSVHVCVARTLISWITSNILVAQFIIMVGRTMKSYCGLDWSLALLNCST